MPVSEVSLRQKIEASFPGATVIQVFDISGGCGASFEVLVVSEEFAGKATLARHRLVNQRLAEEIAELHAFTQKTYTPKQYEALAQKVAQ